MAGARRAGFAIRRFQFPGWGGASAAPRSLAPEFWHLSGLCCQPRQVPARRFLAAPRARSMLSLGPVLPGRLPRGAALAGVSRSAARHRGVKAGARRAAAPGVSPALPAGHAEHPQLPVEHRGPPGPGGHGLCLQSSQQGERGQLGGQEPQNYRAPVPLIPPAPRDARAPLHSPSREILGWGAAQGQLWVLFSFSMGSFPGSRAAFGVLTAGSCSPPSRAAQGEGAVFRGMPRGFENPILGHLHSSCKHLPALERALLLTSL